MQALAPKKPAADAAPAADASKGNAPPSGHVSVTVGPPAVNPEGVIPGTPYVALDGFRTDQDNTKKERRSEDRLGLALKFVLVGCGVFSWVCIHYFTPGG